jgi:7-cyano-7-deazaguanine synthase
MQNKSVVIYSGGMDSYTVLNLVLQQAPSHEDVFALSFDYGQKHIKEIDYAKRACSSLNVNHKVIDIHAINEIVHNSSLTSSMAIPEGHYEDENMKSTFVPNRNMILLSLAIGYAVDVDASKVYYGAHAGDHAIYPDCRPEFVHAMNAVAKIANYDPVEIVTPYLNHSKIEILKEGLAMGLDYSNTWTCYNGREKACGKCGSCVERLESFEHNQLTDPIDYELK